MPKAIMTREDTVALEKSVENYMPSILLMEQAGQCVVREVVDFCDPQGIVVVLCGPGNNAGDGFVVARSLARQNYRVDVFVLGNINKYSSDAQTMLSALAGYPSIRVYTFEDAKIVVDDDMCPAPDVFVDALFGLGLKNDIVGLYADLIQWLNEQTTPVISIDLPSGIDANSGAVRGIAVQAMKTVSFFAPKVGHLLFPGRAYKGELVMDMLISEESVKQLAFDNGIKELLTEADIKDIFPLRPMNAHKGLFGHVLVIGGSVGMVGAVYLSGRAALRSGAGRVSVATEPEVVSSLWSSVPEAMADSWTDSDELDRLIEGKNVLAIGPGFGKNKERARIALSKVHDFAGQVVIDADGLFYLEETDINLDRRPYVVLTPHPKEMVHLLDITMDEVLKDPMQAACQCAAQYHAIVLLKGGSSVVATPDQQASIITAGGPMLAKGGSGDVLTGMISALMAQGHTAYDAARYGSLLLGTSAEKVDKHNATVLPSDVIEAIPMAVDCVPCETQRGSF